MQNTNLNVEPYFDDYQREKDFYKVLFKPGYPVQSRELTTLQSILQNQIERFGQHIFTDGSMVIPGRVAYDLNYKAVTIQPFANGVNVENYRKTLIGKKLIGSISGVTALVLNSLSELESDKGIITLYVKYIIGGKINSDGSQYTIFVDNENLIDITTSSVVAITSLTNSINYTGSSASITSGVYFSRGYFIEVKSQNIILDQYNNKPSYKIGLKLEESIVSSSDDFSIRDNSFGYPNFSAPGADRLKINAKLSKVSLDEDQDSNFIELLRLTNGILEDKIDRSTYAELEKNLARRTYEESGNYYVNPFKITKKETLNNLTNDGAYELNSVSQYSGKIIKNGTPLNSTEIDGNNYFTLQISPGKAYVKGYELETISQTYIDLEKPRTTSSINNEGSLVSYGDYFELETSNLTGSFTSGSFSNLYFFDKTIGSNNANLVGRAKYYSLLYGSKIRLYIVDFSTLTSITLSNSTNLNIISGDIITGSLSGATGVVYTYTNSPSNIIILQQVTGNFINGETITNSRNNTSITINGIIDYKTEIIKSVSSNTSLSASSPQFIANISLGVVPISGKSFVVSNNTTLTGVGTNFLSELYLNTTLQFGNTTTTVSSITSNSQATLSSNIPNQSYTSIFKLISTLKTSGSNHFSLTQNKNVSGISDISYSIVKNYNVTFNNGVGTLTVSAGETASGDVVIQTSTNSMTGTISSNNTITINNNNFSGQATVFVKVLISNPILKQKTLNSCVSLLVNKSKDSLNTVYGTRKEDKEISLAFPDVVKIHTIHQATSNSYTSNNLFDSITVTNSTNFNVGDIVYSNQTNTKGKIISKSSNILYLVYYTDSVFSNSGENNKIKNFTTNAETTISTVTPGSYIDITNNYILDKNINNSIYDISKLIIKSNYATPQYDFIIVYDYYSHGSGDYFSVESYQLNQVKYENIGTYDKNNLSDILDFRITANSISTAGNGTLLSPFILSSNSLSKLDRSLTSRNLLYPGTTSIYDYSYYLGRIDTLILDENGIFEIFKGTPSLSQIKSELVNDNLKVASIIISPYVKNINDVVIEEYDYKRYTMSDISVLDKRLTNVEYYTSLNLLEIDTNNLILTDENGYTRFKNGFAVDSFQNFTISDIDNVDYNVSLDFIKKEARPSHYTNNVDLEFQTSNSTNYKKTGDIITLDYTDEVFITQSSASRAENVNPFNVFAWIGIIDLTPSSDNWITTIRLADNIVRVEGNFESTVGVLGGVDTIVWGNWRDLTGFPVNWQGRERDGERRIIREVIDNISLGDRIVSSTSILYLRERIIGIKLSRMKPDYRLYLFINNINMTNYVIPSLIEINKGGIENTNSIPFAINEKVRFFPKPSGDFQLQGFPTIPNIVATVIAPSNSGFSKNPYNSEILPNNYTGTYSYLALSFESIVNTPLPIDNFLEGGIIMGITSGAIATFKPKKIICDNSGQWNGYVIIPNPNVTTNPKFINGEITFRVTPSLINSRIPGTIDTEAETEFFSSGTTNFVQQTIMSVRNARVDRMMVREADIWVDPLAQSFLVDKQGGIFLTKIDLYFESKAESIPVNIHIRTMENGIPTNKIIPFSDVSLLPSNVNISNNASIPTTFTFSSPVYLNQNTEYAFIVWSNSDNYKVWVAKLGEDDVLTRTRIIKNPYAGVLFKSQNASTWTPDQYEDLKFVMYSAKFNNSSSSELYFYNKPNPDSLLRVNPITMYKQSNIILISHSNHCMHTTDNRVIISGVKSEILDTKLQSPLTNTQNSSNINITLSDASNFHTLIGNQSISSSNPGYMKIGNEIILYSSISGNTVTIPANGRGINNTSIVAHSVNEIVECYNINGIPLIDINKTHLSITPISLDSYNLTVTKFANIDMTSGGNQVFASNNIQFEHIISNIASLAVSGTTISSKINTITGTSISSNSNTQPSYQSIQNEPISIEEINNFSKPRLIASSINESNYNNNNKSLGLNLQLSSNVSNLSPVIDLERCSLITISNRINKLSNNDYSLLSFNTKNEANYVTKIFNLENSSTSVKVLFEGVRFNTNSIRVYVKIGRDDSLSFNDTSYIQLNPISYPSSDNTNDYREFEYEIKNLPQFKSYSVKVELDSDNQSLIPVIRKFRVIAIAI